MAVGLFILAAFWYVSINKDRFASESHTQPENTITTTTKTDSIPGTVEGLPSDMLLPEQTVGGKTETEEKSYSSLAKLQTTCTNEPEIWNISKENATQPSFSEDTLIEVVNAQGQDIGKISGLKNGYGQVFWQKNCTAFYIGLYVEGLGGYYLYFGPHLGLYIADVAKNTLTPIVSNLEGGFISGISSDGALVALSLWERRIRIIDLSGNIVQEFSYPAEYSTAGDVKFSQDGKQVVYAAAVGAPDNERGIIYVGEIASGKQAVFQKSKVPGMYHIHSWDGNETSNIRFEEVIY